MRQVEINQDQSVLAAPLRGMLDVAADRVPARVLTPFGIDIKRLSDQPRSDSSRDSKATGTRSDSRPVGSCRSWRAAVARAYVRLKERTMHSQQPEPCTGR